MIEGRAIISNIEKTRNQLEKMGATLEGEYAFNDVIFFPKKEEFNLSDDFLRIRVYEKTNWPTKNVVLSRKQTEFGEIGKVDKIILKKEFDSEREALDFFEKELSHEFERGFEFSRIGWQYQLGKKRIFVEDIKGFDPSVEVEAENKEELISLFDQLRVIEKMNVSISEAMRKRLDV